MPSSRTARFFLVVLVVSVGVIIGFFALRAKKPQLPPDAGNIALNLKLRQDQIDKLNQDSDHDGLKDWEEFLYHTDPHNPDTDGDGTPDGEEVKLGRDPTKPNTAKSPKKPNDYFATAEPITDSAAPAGAAPNLTADFTRTFLQGPLAQMLTGAQVNFDTKEIARYADRLNGRSVLADAPHFTLTDIRVSPISNGESAKQYVSSLQQIFDVLGTRGESELVIISQVLQAQDYSSIALLAAYPDSYQKAITDIRALPVPKNLVDFHLTILNHLSLFKRSTELLQTIEADPILGILVINERLKLNDEFARYLAQSMQKINAETNK